MTLQYKDIYPAENMETMRKLAENLEGTAHTLKPAVDKCISTYPTGPVRMAFDRIHSVLQICVAAESTLQSRLDEVLNFAAPRRMDHIRDLRARGHVVAPSQLEQHTEHRADHLIEDTGEAKHIEAKIQFGLKKAEDKAASQKHIAVELALTAFGLFSHPAASAIETIKATWKFIKSQNGQKQLEDAISQTAKQIHALDKLEKQLEEMCLFLYLVPELADLKAGDPVTEKIARERLDAAINARSTANALPPGAMQ